MSNKYLLTGAGFSHNFGLPLARQVWGMIFNDPQIQKTNAIRRAMLSSFDYETLYSSILNENQYSSEKVSFLERINVGFNHIFENLCIQAINNEKKYNIDFND